MKRRLLTLGVLAFALSALTTAQGGPPQGGPPGQGGPGGPGMMMGGPGGFGNSDVQLLGRKDVQDDLQLTSDQKAKVAELQKKYQPQRGGPGGGGPGGPPAGGGGFNGAPPGGNFDPDEMAARMEKQQAEQKKAIAAILTEAQVKRLGEIRVQIQGNAYATSPEGQKALGVTEDQMDKIQVAMDDIRENMPRPDFGNGERPDPQQMQAQMKKMQDQLNNAIGAILTADQKAKLKEMGGKAFKRVDPQPGQGRPGGGG